MNLRHLDTKDCLNLLNYYNIDIPLNSVSNTVDVEGLEKLASEMLTTKLCRRINTGFPFVYEKCKKDKKSRKNKFGEPHKFGTPHRKTRKKL